MAPEQSAPQARASWTKIFSAFKIALDMKKLVLAAAGIFVAALGWWVISWAFYAPRTMPVYVIDFEKKKEAAELNSEWENKKVDRDSWNLMHEMAGSYSEKLKVDALDVASNREEYLILKKWEDAFKRSSETILVQDSTLTVVELNNAKFTLVALDDKAKEGLRNLQGRKLTLGLLVLTSEKELSIDGVKLQAEGPSLEKLKTHRDGATSVETIKNNAKAEETAAFEKFKAHLAPPVPKKAGLLRLCPWNENRDGNPYLLVSDVIKTRGDSIGGRSRLFAWIISDQAPVLLEPLVKFLLPIVYLFDHRAGGWERIYLVLMILWTLAVWGFFGGAICRIAAVQVARSERIPLREAVMFTKERFTSYFAAPAFPMVLLGILTFALMIFGWIIWTPWFGEIVAGLLWPIVILIGFVMAIVLVGLIAWPLMVATISAEGTDSFDALSRSYSYLYQAPWQYLWYNFVAILYGVVLVFFIGFMASLMVFLGKWGVSSAVGLASADPKSDREPSYLFYYAPTSFGWRDLLISSNTRNVEPRSFTDYDGRTVTRLEFKEDYITTNNKVGAFLVALWIYPLFLLVVGFGYSYFWSVSTIIYFLMRQHVDDTEMDEVHLEDEDMDDPFLKPPPAAPAAAPPAGKPGTVSLNVVEAPPPPSPPPTAYTTSEPPPPAAPPPTNL